MCVLCGEMISFFHWSDTNFKDKKSLITAGENQKDRMKTRLQKVAILNKILEFYALKLADWQGSKYILSNKKGQNVIVNDLGDLWFKASELEKCEFDALDENLLNFLKRKNA
ncbi:MULTISPECIES: hypothetical protein [unclassified Campylobacter]|uniref:hypothetical protein n=1 Tax=unclassified Campylobacter TaxID=2593542 RepID=UPI001238146B|nr:MULTISPECIES: hypothetical protein [unclassified Campylobacter]KAA6224819.1 hypothetical protein FMM54_07225 [Campylobacter sp. LR185c]KAA6227394.1 hypothetical protein FMM55_03370 [Campylobacter sp. LR196d]KAA6228771.1 hypothetical protein FMM57_02585 [Campylobacter sp. LR286c]KAA6229581.1 hypothetical protein FMM56_08540 [Campylobacter sp. LR264d]KAA6230825.1 hypothetical protein FMM58_05295 [Campylobacter sp. LR291e]